LEHELVNRTLGYQNNNFSLKKEKVMSIKAQRVSKMSNNVTWCRPSEGYNTDDAIEIELNDYEEIETVLGELPESDCKWPKGAPIKNHVKVDNKIF
jgi:hypothetical protein